MSTYLLAGDLRETQSHLAIVSPESGPHRPLMETTLRNHNYPCLEALVRAFLDSIDLPITQASFGVSGSVSNGRATLANLSWVMGESELADVFDWERVDLMNSLAAVANAVPHLEISDMLTLNIGEPSPTDPKVVIDPCTRLCEAFLVHDGRRYRACLSQEKYADFCPSSELEADLYCYLRQNFGHVSWAHVCSNTAIPHIYEYIKMRGFADEPEWLTTELAMQADATSVIIDAALDPVRTSRLSVATLNKFASILGTHAGNTALKSSATGGVYLGGSLPPRILPMLEHERFVQAFRKRGNSSLLLDKIPVHVILNPKAALIGAASYGLAQE